MNSSEQQATVRDFLAKHKLGVIATLHHNGAPEAAVIQVTLADDSSIVFDCFPQSRKFSNISADKRMALVIGWDENVTVQIEGTAERVTDEEVERLKAIHVANCPLENEFLKKGAVLFKVKPTWIRYSDFRNDPTVMFELSGKEPLGKPQAHVRPTLGTEQVQLNEPDASRATCHADLVAIRRSGGKPQIGS